MPAETVTHLQSLADSPDLAMLVLQEIKARFEQYLATLDVTRIVTIETEELDRVWSNPENRLQLAPGEEILTEVYRTFGSEYIKPEDTRRIAKEMRADEIHPEIAEIIRKAKDLTA